MSKKDLGIGKEVVPETNNKPATIPEGPTGMASNITPSDLRLPRVALLQSKSPQVEREEAKAGQFLNTLTQEVIESPVIFTPVFVFKNVIKYKPREQGGGIIYKTTNFTPEVIKDITWDGATKPAATQFINAVVLVKGQDIPLIISFSMTSFKTGQDLLTLIQLSGQAWKFHYALESVKAANAKGSYYVMRVKRLRPTDADTIIEAVSLYDQVKGMSIDTDFEGADHADSTSTGAEPTEF